MFIASIQAELRSDVQGRDDGKVKKTKNYYFKSEYQKKEVNTECENTNIIIIYYKFIHKIKKRNCYLLKVPYLRT